MFTLIKKILKPASTPSVSQSPDDQNKLAACVILLEAAHIDNQCSDEEMEHIVATMKKDFSLGHGLVEELLELANRRREEAVDLWQFTNAINQNSNQQQKMAIMESVWQLIFADGKLDMHEDYFAHKLANLLRLSHEEMIQAKLTAKNR